MAENKDRVTLSLREGVVEMLRAEFPHQNISFTIQMLVEMAIDAELILSQTKLEQYAKARRNQKAAMSKIPLPVLPPLPQIDEDLEKFGE